MNTLEGVISRTGLLHLAFNQDQGCFSCGLEKGFRIFNSDPLREQTREEFDEEPEESETGFGAVPLGRGIGRICMLFRCNYLALVGGGRAPRFARDQLVLWNAGRRGTPLQLSATATLDAPERLLPLALRDDPTGPALPTPPAHSRPPVRNLCLSKERLVAVLEEYVLVYSLGSQLEPLAVLRSAPNREGLAALVANSSQCLLAYPITGSQLRPSASASSLASSAPALSAPASSAPASSSSSPSPAALQATRRGPGTDKPAEGSVRVVDLSRLAALGSSPPSSTEASATAERTCAPGDADGDHRSETCERDERPARSALERMHVLDVPAHKTPLASLQLSLDAQLLATASSKGTLIRLFNTIDGNLVHELRRGTTPAQIYCMNFNRDASLLCVASSHGTIHLFNLADSRRNKSAIPLSVKISSAREMHLPRSLSAAWAFCRIDVGAHSRLSRALAATSHNSDSICWPPMLCAFGTATHDEQTTAALLVLVADGTYLKFRVDLRTAEYTKEIEANFLALDQPRH